jgi:glycopeptide antibiotics resistance protein
MDVFAYRLLATVVPLALLAIVAGRLAYVVARRRPNSGPDSPRRAATRALLGSYALGLGWWTIVIANPGQDGSRRANLVPFREIVRSLTDREPGYGLLNFWGNIVAFVPVGVLALLTLRHDRRHAWLVALTCGTALSVALEISQYGVGRSADIDDVILNAIGVALGVTFAYVARRPRTRSRTLSPPETGATQ